MDIRPRRADETFRVKPVISLVQPQRALTEDLIKLSHWIRDYYGCGLQSVFESMIPSVVRSGRAAPSAKEVSLLRFPDESELSAMRRRAPRQHEIVQSFIKHPDPALKAELSKTFGASAVDSLIEKGILSEGSRGIKKSAYDDDIAGAEIVSAQDHELNAEQSSAFKDICALLEKREFASHLLYGVTGSGKTEIYIQAMRRVLNGGGSCIFLVPEIALTPQTVGRLRSRLGNCGTKLVVWHSNLSDGERLEAWRELAKGEARVVVGARSCIFAPLENLRLIIVDEEHDSAYKQDSNPRYNARDVAVMRANFADGVCVLGSATPSLETLFNTKNGKYSISKITKRIDGCRLPTVLIADMKRERAGSVISRMLHDKIGERLERGEQTILFLNRRGYAKVYECPDCAHVEECPHCSISLTWHKSSGRMKCHVCGHEARAPLLCPKCASEAAKWRGAGTQKIEEIISKAFPHARIGRMDADSMRRRDDYRKTLGDFRMGKLDILIGTQMIAKGLDFPRVTLVGIIDADISLHMPDFRAAERTYQLIVQVAGRAGRGEGLGEVVVQTRRPEEAPIQYAKSDDMEGFLEEELAHRAEYHYPPSRRIIRHLFKSRSQEKLSFYAENFAKLAEEKLSCLCEIRGPAPEPIEKVEDHYRWQIWYFCKNVKKVVSILSALRREFAFDEDVLDVLDVDPS